MKRIAYAGIVVITGDRIADAIISYAAALARQGGADAVSIPAVDEEGNETSAQILIGPASQLVVEPVDTGTAELTDESLVSWLDAQTARLGPSRPVLEDSVDSPAIDDFDVVQD
jgi:hypothetical protein